jgi:4a-hydroxytetrahydrobiopterin dehydratase
MMPVLLEPEAVQRLLGEVPDWRLDGNTIARTFQFENFSGAVDFVNKVAGESESMDHHPDIDIRWNKVKLTLATHSAGGLTDMDFTLARRIDRLV